MKYSGGSGFGWLVKVGRVLVAVPVDIATVAAAVVSVVVVVVVRETPGL